MDEIYMKIKKELGQKLENEEIKGLNLKAEVEQMTAQMTAQMKELKDQLATAKALTTTSDGGSRKGSSPGYKIGYDSSLIDGQDASEEFFFSHSYSPSTVRASSSVSNLDSTLMSCSDVENDEEDDDDADDADDADGQAGDGARFSLTQKSCPLVPTPSRRASVPPTNALPTLAEEEEEEEEEEEAGNTKQMEGRPVSNQEGGDDDMDSEHEDAPRTMMEIILQRQQSHSPEDDMEDPPADANETFETMAQKTLFHAVQSKFTVAQAQLQLEELVLKFDARLEQTVDVIAKVISRWWETERLTTGGSISGGWGQETVISNNNKKTNNERVHPKVAIEKRVESFFGPLLWRPFLNKDHANTDPRWLKNHNPMLVALYKYDVVDTEAVLEWWQALEEEEEEEPQGGVFGGGNNLRSLNSKFAEWLEDDDDDEDDSDSEDCCSDEDEDEDEEDDMEQDEDDVVESILDLAFPVSRDGHGRQGRANESHQDKESMATIPSDDGNDHGPAAAESKRINFCTNNNLYYSPDGRVARKKDHLPGSEEKNKEARKNEEDPEEVEEEFPTESIEGGPDFIV
ncbi:hypothetical protein BGZ65_004680 [Modicella reniformis]|uniref:W2 domain-containing protein n=1 Tax=Modicella reniformis TaxID=1440133 RepID=A0A9P6LRQ7_9FUNG|nr:hypothetical protein BGZ65_004680 [Modicella reniformis]